jgi:hypothetical protein
MVPSTNGPSPGGAIGETTGAVVVPGVRSVVTGWLVGDVTDDDDNEVGVVVLGPDDVPQATTPTTSIPAPRTVRHEGRRVTGAANAHRGCPIDTEQHWRCEDPAQSASSNFPGFECTPTLHIYTLGHALVIAVRTSTTTTRAPKCCSRSPRIFVDQFHD